MLRRILAFLWIAHLLIAQPSGHYPSSMIADSVNVVTGQCCIFAHDMTIRGAEPIPINRVYINRTEQKERGGWYFIPHLRLYREIGKGDDYNTVHFNEPDGNTIYFNIPEQSHGDWIPLDISEYKTFKSWNRSDRETISGETNIRNIKAQMSKDKKDIYVTRTNGCKRYYRQKDKLTSGKTRKYLLQWEDLPNGNRLKYLYDSDYKLEGITAFNPETDKTFTEWRCKNKTNPVGAPNFNGEASDGQWSHYVYEHYEEEKEKYQNTLELVVHLEKPEERYTYTEPGRKKGRLIETRTFAGKHTIKYVYYKKGLNRTNYHECECKESEDFRIDRVKVILVNNKPRYFFEYGDEKKGSRFTNVWDNEGNLTVYHYNDVHQITKIKRHDKEGHLVNTELYFYNTDNRKNELISAALLDRDDQPLTCTTYAYDTWGNITEEKHYGDITGQNTFKIRLDHRGIPLGTGIDWSRKTFEYSQDGRNLLLLEIAENGLETQYHYPAIGNLLQAKFLKYNGKIYRRTFYIYKDNLLFEEIHDDGSSPDRQNLTDVTERQIFRTHHYAPGPSVGMPEWVEESCLDLATMKEIPVIKTNLTYYPSRKVHEKHVYDNENKLKYTQTYGYDKHNNLTSETDPLGRASIATYNEFLKKEIFIDFDGQLTHRYDYDDQGRLYRTTQTDPDGNSRVETCKYNSKDECISTTDWHGNTTTYSYDMLGNCICTTLPDGTTLTTAYNALSHPISQIDGNGFETKIRPNIYNKPIQIDHPDGIIERYRYHLDGNLAEEIEPHGTATKYQYDHFNRLVETAVYSSGTLHSRETSVYTTLHLFQKFDQLGQAITYQYDQAGRKILETDGTLTSTFGYDTLSRLSTIKTGGCTTTTRFDLLDRPIEETTRDKNNTLVSQSSYTYDPFGNKKSTTRSINGHPATETIDTDAFSRPIRLTDAMGNRQIIIYNDHYQNSKGQYVQCKTEIAPNGNQTTTLYDILDRVVSIEIRSPQNTLLTSRTLEYDHNNNCINQIDTITEGDSSWEIATFRAYTPGNKIEKLIEAHKTKDQKTTTYHYDHSGRLKTQTEANGNTISYTYNPTNQIETLNTKNVSYRYHYDLLGRIIEVEDLLNGTSTLRTYEKNHLKKEVLGNGLTFKNKYDTEGRRILFRLPDRTTIEYGYDSYHLRSITRTNSHTTYTHEFHEYDLSSNLLAETNATHRYNPNGQKDQIDTPHLTQTVTERDPLGNILTKTTNATNAAYTYSPLSQLTSEPAYTYTYDTLHNRTSKNNQTYTYNNANQLQTTPTATITNDKAGYPLSKTTNETLHYTFDGLGRLIEAHTTTWRLTFVYDSFNRCLSRTHYHKTPTGWIPSRHQNFLYDDACEIGSADQNNNILELRVLRDTTHAEIGATIALELNGLIYFPLHDLQGNICGLLDENHNLIELISYTAYGESPPITSPWGYCSKRYDPQLALTNFGRRFYDASAGRFLTPDPKGFVDGLNLYAYCLNNPLNKIDLYGQNVNIQFSMDLSTAINIASTASTILGHVVYQSFNHLMPIPGVREAGMAVGNVLSRNWTRPCRPQPSSYNQLERRKRDDCRFLSINGILNNKDSARETADYISECLGGLDVEYYHSTTRGFILDILGAFCAKLGMQTADSIEIARRMSERIGIMRLSTDDPKLFVFAHSRGGAYLATALKLMKPEELKVIHANTYGSASLFRDIGLGTLQHYIAKGDPVPMTDPCNYIKGYLFHSPNIRFLQGQGSFWTRHAVLECTYADQIKRDTDKILSMIGE